MAYSLIAYYNISQEFKLPKCLRCECIQSLEDLDKHPLIQDWWIKYGCLYIEWKDGTTTEIEGTEYDLKRPDEIEICKKEDTCLYDEESPSEEESEEESTIPE